MILGLHFRYLLVIGCVRVHAIQVIFENAPDGSYSNLK